jgi:hypothetical protein
VRHFFEEKENVLRPAFFLLHDHTGYLNASMIERLFSSWSSERLFRTVDGTVLNTSDTRTIQ